MTLFQQEEMQMDGTKIISVPKLKLGKAQSTGMYYQRICERVNTLLEQNKQRTRCHCSDYRAGFIFSLEE